MTNKEIKLRDNLFKKAYDKYFILLKNVEREVDNEQTIGYIDYTKKQISYDMERIIDMSEYEYQNDQYLSLYNNSYVTLNNNVSSLLNRYKSIDINSLEKISDFQVDIDKVKANLILYIDENLVNGLEYSYVEYLPTIGEPNKVYLLDYIEPYYGDSGSGKEDTLLEYIYINNAWERLGYISSSELDLSYYTETINDLSIRVNSLYNDYNNYYIEIKDVADNYLTYIEYYYIRSNELRLTTFSGHNEYYKLILNNGVAQQGSKGNNGNNITINVSGDYDELEHQIVVPYTIVLSTSYFPNNYSSVELSNIELNQFAKENVYYHVNQDSSTIYFYGGEVNDTNHTVAINTQLTVKNGSKGDKGDDGDNGYTTHVDTDPDNLTVFHFKTYDELFELVSDTQYDFGLRKFSNEDVSVVTIEHNNETYVQSDCLYSTSLMVVDQSTETADLNNYTTSVSNTTITITLHTDSYYHTIYSGNTSLGTIVLNNGTSVHNQISNITDDADNIYITLLNLDDNTTVTKTLSKTINIPINDTRYNIQNIDSNIEFIDESNITITSNGIIDLFEVNNTRENYPNLLKLIWNDTSNVRQETDIILHNTDRKQNDFYSFDSVFNYDESLNKLISTLTLYRNNVEINHITLEGVKGSETHGEDGTGLGNIEITQNKNTQTIVKLNDSDDIEITIPSLKDEFSIESVSDYSIKYNQIIKEVPDSSSFFKKEVTQTTTPYKNSTPGYGIYNIDIQQASSSLSSSSTVTITESDGVDSSNNKTITLTIPNKESYSNELTSSQDTNNVTISTEHNNVVLENKPEPTFTFEQANIILSHTTEESETVQRFTITDKETKVSKDFDICNGTWIGNYPLITNKTNNFSYIGKNIDTEGLGTVKISEYFAGEVKNSSYNNLTIFNDLAIPVIVIINTDSKDEEDINNSKMIITTINPNSTYELNASTYIWYIYKVGITETSIMDIDSWA